MSPKSTAKSTAKKAGVVTTKATESTDESKQPVLHDVVRTEPGGIDPRLVETREQLKAIEADVRLAPPSAPTIDPKLIEIREMTRAREEGLANRPTTEGPPRA
jgi:hypothetical protein